MCFTAVDLVCAAPCQLRKVMAVGPAVNLLEKRMLLHQRISQLRQQQEQLQKFEKVREEERAEEELREARMRLFESALAKEKKKKAELPRKETQKSARESSAS